MPSLLKKLSQIGDKVKFGVYGWIREAENELKLLQPIVPGISDICLLYYHEDEKFDIVSKSVKKAIDAQSITKINNGLHNTNYGAIEIASSTENIYRWDFKIRKIGINVIIGITAANEINPDIFFTRFPKRLWKNTYALCTPIGHVYDEGKWDTVTYSHDEKFQFNKNDKITMIYNQKTSRLYFLKDESIEIIVCYKIKQSKDIKFKMFVTLNITNDCVELLNFSRQ